MEQNYGHITVGDNAILSTGIKPGGASRDLLNSGLITIEQGGALLNCYGGGYADNGSGQLIMDGLYVDGDIDFLAAEQYAYFTRLDSLDAERISGSGQVILNFPAKFMRDSNYTLWAQYMWLFDMEVCDGYPVYSLDELELYLNQGYRDRLGIDYLRIMADMTIPWDADLAFSGDVVRVESGVTLNILGSFGPADHQPRQGVLENEGWINLGPGGRLSGTLLNLIPGTLQADSGSVCACGGQNSGIIRLLAGSQLLLSGGTLINQAGGQVNMEAGAEGRIIQGGELLNLDAGAVVLDGRLNICDEGLFFGGSFVNQGDFSGSGTLLVGQEIGYQLGANDFSGYIHHLLTHITDEDELSRALQEYSEQLPFLRFNETVSLSQPTTISNRTLNLSGGQAGFTGGPLTLVRCLLWYTLKNAANNFYANLAVDLNGGVIYDWNPSSKPVDADDNQVQLPPAPCRGGYKFIGWQLEDPPQPEDGDIYGAGEWLEIDQGQTLRFHAAWVELNQINVYNQTQLQQALASNKPVTDIAVCASFTIDQQLLATNTGNLNDAIISVQPGVPLTIAAGGSLGVAWYEWENWWECRGRLLVAEGGSVVVQSGGSCGPNNINRGQIIIEDGGWLNGLMENSGSVRVSDGGIFATSQGERVRNNGLITIDAGGIFRARFGGAYEDGGQGQLVLNGLYLNGEAEAQGRGNMTFTNPDALSASRISGSGVVAINYDGNDQALLDAYRACFGGDIRVQYGAPAYTRREMQLWLGEENPLGAAFVRVQADQTIDYELFFDEYVRIERGVTVTIAEDGCFGAAFMSDGYLQNEGAISVQNGGQLDSGQLGNQGTITVENGGLMIANGHNSGTVTIKSGGIAGTSQGSGFSNHGLLDIQAGGEYRTQMGSRLANNEGGQVRVNGTLNVSDKDDVMMFGGFHDGGGQISGNGVVNVANCDIAVTEDFAGFAGTYINYVDSVANQAQLQAALTSDRPFLFITTPCETPEDPGQLIITQPTVIENRKIIVYFVTGDDYLSKDRSLAIGTGGSLTLIDCVYCDHLRTQALGGRTGRVSLDLAGGTLTDWTPWDGHLRAEGEKLALPEPTREGYIFAGWLTESFRQPNRVYQAGEHDIEITAHPYFTALWAVADPAPQPTVYGDGLTLEQTPDTCTLRGVVINNDQPLLQAPVIYAAYDAEGRLIALDSQTVTLSAYQAAPLNAEMELDEAELAEAKIFLLDPDTLELLALVEQ